MNYEHLVTVEPGQRSGKPCIRGMCITVYDVLEYLASGMTKDEILADFSEMPREDIKACLAFAADHERGREKFDRVLAKVPEVEPDEHDRLSPRNAT